MNKLALSLALLALTGCTFCREHKTTCAVVGWAAATTVALSATNGRNHTGGVDGRDYTILPVDCAAGACK